MWKTETTPKNWAGLLCGKRLCRPVGTTALPGFFEAISNNVLSVFPAANSRLILAARAEEDQVNSNRLTTSGAPNTMELLGSFFLLAAALVSIGMVPLNWTFAAGSRATHLGVDSADRTVPQLAQAFFFLCLLVYLAITRPSARSLRLIPGQAFLVLSSYMLLSVFFSHEDLPYRLRTAIASLQWVVTALVVSRHSANGRLSTGQIFCFSALTTLVAAAYMLVFFRQHVTADSVNLENYLLIWCIPLLLLGSPRGRNLLLVSLAVIPVALSLKRGAALCLVSGFCVYGVTYICIAPAKGRFRGKVIALLLIAIVVVAVGSQWEKFSHTFATESTQGVGRYGSGRVEMWTWIVKEVFRSDPFSLVFGHGFMTLPKRMYGRLGIAGVAHSDWLQILWDMGVVGIVLFAYVHVRLLVLLRFAWAQRHQCAPALAMGYTIFAMRNLFSGTAMPAGHDAVYFALLIGYASGITLRDFSKRIGVD